MSPESIEKAAARRLEREEQERRADRLAGLEQEVREDRARERRELQERKRREAALAKAALLRGKRRELENAAEEQVAPLVRTLNELVTLDREHMSVLSGIGELPLGASSARRTVGQWLSLRLSAYLGGPSSDGRDGSLAERDPLTHKRS
jgi:hypothetical protein